MVVAAAGVYALLALGVDAPRVHPDEETYLLAAASLADGHGLAVRGADYGFGPLLPILLAAIIRIAGNVDAAYDWFKTANALLFALTAVPVYLIARRLVPGWWAVLAAALSVGIPSSISIGTVMTESLSYLAAAVALSVMMVALERPTLLRQLALLSAIAVAFLARSQLGVLYVTWVGALGVVWLIAPAMRPRGRADVIRLWPTAMPVLAAPLVVVAKVVTGGTATETLGGYSVLWRDYDPVEVGKWFVYHLGDFAVYLAIVPVAVAPIVLWQLARAGRDGSRSAAAFVALFASANVCGLLVVAAFSSTPYGFERLHDRYGFYLLPLWLVGLVVWLAAGLPRPRGGVLRGRRDGARLSACSCRSSGSPRKRGSTPFPAPSGCGSTQNWPGPGLRPAASRWGSSSSRSSQRRSCCRDGSRSSPCRRSWRSRSRRPRTSRGSG